MFDAIRHIDVDRKNSLPVADFINRYRATRTPVVFGDMTHRWPAYKKWNLAFFRKELGDLAIDVYSHKVVINGGYSSRPINQIPANDYFDLLLHDEDELQVRDLNILKINRYITEDFKYPRLGLRFKKQSPRLHIGGSGAMEHMHFRPDLAESFLCNFGGRQTVLLVRPEQAKYTYEPPWSFESLSTVDYSEAGLINNPALSKLDAYIAELNHGDVLYIPSKYRYAVHYSTISFGLILAASPKSIYTKLQARHNKYIVKPLDSFCAGLFGRNRWQRRRVRKAVRRSRG
ncbi:MAG: cupin-like domain-containing protein [Gammaproteobacteria bacterium]|nr:cupin-like domain-containing protein [Gammaproteobacteria bacterium]